jgi:hypothetical protein
MCRRSHIAAGKRRRREMTTEQREKLITWVGDLCGDEFDVSWQHLQIHGVCDSIGSLEYQRVKREWWRYQWSKTHPGRGGSRTMMSAGKFIAQHANITDDAPALGHRGDPAE